MNAFVDSPVVEPETTQTPTDDSSADDFVRDDELFEREMLPHLKSLYHFALRLSGNEDDAHDLVQDTYLKAYRF
ncbi:MAG: RNA polymerase subunit sigma, partial [Bacteroidia bacterium]|nr:RNA polymerase subunit sigma [Bacteroidia bacterium]